MAFVKFTGEEALGRVADYVNKKLAFASSMPESPDTNAVVMYIGTTTSDYRLGSIYQFDGTDWVCINSSIMAVEITQAEYNALPQAVQLNGDIYFITDAGTDGGNEIVQGYYNPADGKFYEESTYTTEITPSVDCIYIDLTGNKLYRYSSTNTEYFMVSGGSADNIIWAYYNSADGKFYEDSSYTTEITPNAENIYIDLGDNKIYRYDITDTEYVIIGGGGAGGGAIEGYYNATDGKFYEESTFVTEITGEEGQIYVDKGGNKTYRYDATNTEFVLIGGSDYTAGFGININTNDEISTTDFVGTQATWDALPATDKTKYDFIHITDDTSSIVYKPGHSISDGTTEKTQRDGLVFEGFEVTDDSTNEVTKIAEIPYIAGDGVEITNHEVSVKEDRPATFVGTTQEWDALTTAEKAQYKVVNLTNDVAGGDMVVVDVVAKGNYNAVSSNAVAEAVEDNDTIEAIVNTYGSKNLIPYPYDHGNSRTADGTTYTVSSDGSIVITGTATADNYFQLSGSNKLYLSAGTYKLTGCPSGLSSQAFLYLAIVDKTTSTWISSQYDLGQGVEFTLTDSQCIGGIYLQSANGFIGNEVTFYPMIRDVRIKDDTYVPYAMTNTELTKRATTSNIDTNGAVDISSYTAYANSFKVPEDGIVIMKIGANISNHGAVGLKEGIDILRGYGNNTGLTIMSYPLKKGQGIMVHYNQGSGNLFTYYPYKY